MTALAANNSYEVADVFRRYGAEYRGKNGITKRQHNVMLAVERCRTEWYGCHEDKCDNCGHIESAFNSCRDRHCPKCQGVTRRKWVNSRLSDILPVSYYHVVFTLPHLLQPLLHFNKKHIYNLLFSSAADTLLTFGRDPKWLGGEIGFFGILHTWGQKLWQHPHVHFIVPGGALTAENQWKEPRYKSTFLFPVRALSKVFRGKFIEGLKTAHAQGAFSFSEETSDLKDPRGFERWIDRLVGRDWVVYCKAPFGDADQVVRYIGRYTHRIAISNNRIRDIQDDKVHFTYKDYKDKHKRRKLMSLATNEFIRRFLWHVLPTGFHKIRHYGFLANGRRKASITQIKMLLHKKSHIEEQNNSVDWRMPCPQCRTGKLIPHLIITRFYRLIRSIALPLEGGKCREYKYDTS